MRTTFIDSGDSFITRHVAKDGYDGFDALCDLIGKYDVRFANLEMTFHRQEGYPSATSGGTWAMTDPTMLDDMASTSSTPRTIIPETSVKAASVPPFDT